MSTVFYIIVSIAVPVVSIFAVIVLLKASNFLTHFNRTIQDVRPRVNILLIGLNDTVFELNKELEKVNEITEETREVVERVGSGIESVELTMKSPAVKLGGAVAGISATALLIKWRYGKIEKKREKQRAKIAEQARIREQKQLRKLARKEMKQWKK